MLLKSVCMYCILKALDHQIMTRFVHGALKIILFFLVNPAQEYTLFHSDLLSAREALTVTSACSACLGCKEPNMFSSKCRKNLELTMIHKYLQLDIVLYVLLSCFCYTPCLLSYIFMNPTSILLHSILLYH